MENTIRINKKNEYVIEVNDNGDIISFNLDDPELMLKFDNTLHKVSRIQNNFKAQEQIIKKQQDVETNGLLSRKERLTIENQVNMYKELRIALDEFLGADGCQKIFGDSNYLTMFDDLFEQLEPHFAMMKLNAETFKEEVIKKYGDTEEDVLE